MINKKIQKKNLILIFLVFIFLFLPLLSAVSISSGTNITSNGLNSTIEVTENLVSVEQLIVYDNAITFYNLNYLNPATCTNQYTVLSLYNFTTPNITESDSDVFSGVIDCGEAENGSVMETITPVITPVTLTKIVPVISPDAPFEFEIKNPNVDVEKIIIQVINELRGVSLTVTKVSDSSEEYINSGLPIEQTYQMFKINPKKITGGDIANVIINFKVDKKWLIDKEQIMNNIKLYRKENNAAEWNKLTTNFVKEDNKYYYFSASSSGFSTFAVFAESKECSVDEKKCSENELWYCSENFTWTLEKKCILSCEEEKCVEPLEYVKKSTAIHYIIIGIVAVTLLIVFYSLMERKKGKKRQKNKK